MEFVNTTAHGARLINTVMGQDQLLAAVIARPTFRVESGELIPDPDQPWPIEPAPMETPYGTFPPDTPYLNGGIDVFVIGTARQPDAMPRPRLDVEIRVGNALQRSVAIFGDRVWTKSGDQLVPSEPEPFVEMPLTYENAYGGKVQLDEGELAWAPNPVGKGYYLSAEQAEGQLLPNLEDPTELIRTYRDQPETVGIAPYPSDGALKLLNALDLEVEDIENARIKKIKPLLHNIAHPKMVIPPRDTPGAGDRVTATNVGPSGTIQFPMPDLAMHIHVQLEDRSYVFPLHLDQIGIIADESRVLFSCRAVFKYAMIKRERRRVTLHAGAAPAEIPTEYVAVWENEEVPL